MRCTECCKSMAAVVQLIGERKKRLGGVTGCGVAPQQKHSRAGFECESKQFVL